MGRGRRIAAVAWIAILAITGGFQFYRDAPVDATIFCLLAAALLADLLGAFRRVPLRNVALHRALMLGSAVIAAGLLAFSPRHGVIDAAVVAIAGLLALLVAWPDHAGDVSAPLPPSRGFVRTAWLWAGVLLAICFWELAMYILGSVSGRSAFPALSDLLDPLVENPLGRILFVMVWVLAGIALLRRGATQ